MKETYVMLAIAVFFIGRIMYYGYLKRRVAEKTFEIEMLKKKTSEIQKMKELLKKQTDRTNEEWKKLEEELGL